VFRIGFHDSGRMDHRINGKAAVSLPDRAILHAPGQELRVESEPFRMLFLALHGDMVRRAMKRHFALIPPIETWATEFPLYAAAAAAALKSLCRWTAAELERPGSVLLTSPRAAASLERSLLALLLEAMEAQHPAGDTQVRDLAVCQVHRIEEWMDAHLTDPVGIEDLAVVVGAGPRSLQRAFRRLRGCSPMQAFQQRRLELAKRMLEAATPATTVTEVATECGFFHLGRFSDRYRQAFGELPSLTLARRRKAAD
jgi:AraC-like DNA-binding protein